MEIATCPYCQSTIRMHDIEINDGTCPECGAPVTGSLLFSDGNVLETGDNEAGSEDAEEGEEGEKPA